MRYGKHTQNRRRSIATLAGWVLLLAAVLSLPGCTGNEGSRGHDTTLISFSAGSSATVTAPMTRAEGDYDSDRPQIEKPSELAGKNVYIFGANYPKAQSAITDAQWLSNRFMDGVMGTVELASYASPDAAAGETAGYGITYAPLKYYDPAKRYKYDFIAVYPTDPGDSQDGSGNETDGIIFTPGTTTTTPKLWIDLFKRFDVMIARSAGQTNQDAPVTMKFEHQLSMITINIIKDNALKQNIYLDEMKIMSGGITRGTLDIMNGQWSHNPATDVTTGASFFINGYPYPGDPTKPPGHENSIFIPPFNEGGEATGSPNDPRHVRNFFVFPRTPSTNNLTYVFEVILNEVPFSFTLPKDPDNDVWVAGEHYYYTIYVTGTDIYILYGKPGEDDLLREKWLEQLENISII